MSAPAGPQEHRGTGWTDRVLELDVGPVAHGGHCVARHEGRVVFVRHALPGERVLAVVVEDPGGGFCRADAVSVQQPSPQRVPPPCVWARAGGCGGCDFQHVDPAAQRRLKADVLAEQLRRLAGIERAVEVEELPVGLPSGARRSEQTAPSGARRSEQTAPSGARRSEQTAPSGAGRSEQAVLGWRHRVRLAVDELGRAGLRAHRSHDVLPIADCPIAPAGALTSVLERRWEPASEVEVVVDADGVVHAGDDEPVVQRAAGREWRLSPGVFWQVHPALPDTLAAVVREWAAAPAGGTAWDLYGGVGLFAAVLAEQVGSDGLVTVVESARQAVADGRAALADLPQVDWRVGRVERVLGSLRGRPDVLVADPPRRGLGRQLVEALAARGPDRVVHVACDPAALARDVALFAAGGYRLDALRAFDAFPMTHHFECVALLVRSDREA